MTLITDPVLAASEPAVFESFLNHVAVFLRDDPTLKAMGITVNDETYQVPEERSKFPAVDITDTLVDPNDATRYETLLRGTFAIVIAVHEPRVTVHSPQLPRVRDAVYRRMNLLGGRDNLSRELSTQVKACRMLGWQKTNRYQLLAPQNAAFRSVHDGLWLYRAEYQEYARSIPPKE